FPFRVAWTVIIPVVAVTAGIFMFAVSAGVKAQMSRPTTGVAGLVEEVGGARTPVEPEGQGMVRGELWTGVTEGATIAAGERVRVVAVEGLRLHVERAPAGEA